MQAERSDQRIEESRQELLAFAERETATTLKVMRAYPPEQAELKPTPILKSARELAWMFTSEMKLCTLAIRDEFDIRKGWAEAPATLGVVIETFDAARDEMLGALRECSVESLRGTVAFPTGPGQMGDFPKLEFLRFIMHDQIHHRGQFSIYLRLAGGKLPSIYGPTADEPWR